jgi:quercetin dioxygenase-like cupin family protein
MLQSTAEIAVNPSDETIRIGPLVVRFLLAGDASDGSAAVFECAVPAGEMLRAPAHSHDAYEETIYGLEGVLTWTIEGRPIEVAPGQALCIPRGAVHRFDNVGQDDARALIIATPALIGPEYFREVAEEMAAAAGGPPDHKRMAAIYHRYGLTPALPGA